MKHTVNRNEELDIIKALGIVFMVAGHSGFPLKNWVYLFHMAIFFMTSGYCLKESYSDNGHQLVTFFKKKVLSLYLPFVTFNSILVLLNNLLISIHMIEGYTYNISNILSNLLECILFIENGQLNGAMWFLRTLFVALIIYVSAESILKKICPRKFEICKTIIFGIALVIIWLLPHHIPIYPYLNSFSVLMFIQLGHLLKKYKIKFKPYYGIASFIMLTYINFFGISITVHNNNFINPLIFLVCGIAGYIFCSLIAGYVMKFNTLKTAMCYVGQNTLPIVILHFICMKFVTLIQIIIYHSPIEMLASHPNYISDKGWWLVYTMVGVGMPLWMNRLRKTIAFS